MQKDTNTTTTSCTLRARPEVEGYEADDVIATSVAAARAAGLGGVVIATADKDLMQLVAEDATRVTLWNDMQGREVTRGEWSLRIPQKLRAGRD